MASLLPLPAYILLGHLGRVCHPGLLVALTLRWLLFYCPSEAAEPRLTCLLFEFQQITLRILQGLCCITYPRNGCDPQVGVPRLAHGVGALVNPSAELTLLSA